MDVRELQVTDEFDCVCPNESCEHGTHKFTVVKREGTHLVLIFHHVPYTSIQAHLDDKELWLTNGTRLEVADIQKNTGAEVLEKYERYEDLVRDARAHGLDDLGFEFVMTQQNDARDMVTALLKDPRVDKTSELAYGLLKVAGYEPTEQGIAVMVRAISHFQKNGNPLGLLSLRGLGNILFGDNDE